MSLAILRDPSKRSGGGAIITLPDGDSPTVHVVITMDNGTSTLGPHGWQGSDHAFGPYEVKSGPKGQFVRIGPEIVDLLEAYDPIEVAVPERSASLGLSWPADILPSPGRAGGGGVRVIGDAQTTGQKPASPPPPPPPPPPAEPEPAPPEPGPPEPDPPPRPAQQPDPVVTPAPPPAPEPATGKRSRSMLIIPIALALAAVIGAVVFFTGAETPGPQTAAPASDCTRDHLRTVLRDPALTVEALRPLLAACQAKEDRDLEVRVLDRLGALGDAGALLQYTQWYDPSTAADATPFSAEPELAARYYKRAIEAGSADAGTRLAQLCTTLRGRPDRDSGVIVEIYCQ